MLEVLLREFICLVARYKHGANVLEFCVKANPVVTFSVDKTSFVSGAGLHRLESTMNVNCHQARQFQHLGHEGTSQVVATIAPFFWFPAVGVHCPAF